MSTTHDLTRNDATYNKDNDKKFPEIEEMESLCLNCYKNGVTKLLMVKVPFFREVVVSSFECTSCGSVNRSVDQAASIQNKGKRFVLDVRCPRDLNRRVIQPCHSTIRIPSLDSSFPSSESALTTVEGVINSIIDKLALLQPERREADPEQAELIDAFLEKLRGLLTLQDSFLLELDDPSGNGYIENLHAPLSDPQVICCDYKRTVEQNELLGFQGEETCEDVPDNSQVEDLKDSVSTFSTSCPSCHAECPTNMKIIEIPHFKEVIIMAMRCELCGYRNNEVKSISGISEMAKRYRLLIADEVDLSRDILKSETACIRLPELEFETTSGTMGSHFTTIEGILVSIRDRLKSMNPLLFGDSATKDDKMEAVACTCKLIDDVLSLTRKDVHLELDDPAGNSYLQSLNPEGLDERLEVAEYARSNEQNEDLGLNDMKTVDY